MPATGSIRQDPPAIDWEDAFSNGDYIDDAASYPPRWEEEAQAFRLSNDGTLDIPYGPHPRETLDLFLPKEEPKGLMVFVHGGYWLAFDKSGWSALAAGALARGWAAALPSYTLAPEARLPQITAQIAAAVQTAAALVAGPIVLAGHSAGGHLVTRMACQNGPLDPETAGRLERVVSISGVHDLRPLLLHSMNERLNLTPQTAAAESPALLSPLPHVQASAWVGANERPEFLRQSALLAEAWGARLVAEPDRHHFDVIDGLKDPAHPLCTALLGG